MAGERIAVSGDSISFIDIVSTLLNKPFDDMAITGQLHDDVCLRASKEGRSLSGKSTAEIQGDMRGTMASSTWRACRRRQASWEGGSKGYGHSERGDTRMGLQEGGMKLTFSSMVILQTLR